MIPFGEFRPDQPDLIASGEVLNCIWRDGAYRPFLALSEDTNALTARAQGAASFINSSGAVKTYAGDAAKLYDLSSTTWTDRSGSSYSTPSTGYWKFASFCGKCIAVNGADAPQSVSLTGTTFGALSGSPPTASEIGVIGRFLVLGNISSNPHRIQWSAIDDPEDWPTPLTNDARAKQSGRQDFNEGYGEVRHIVEGELDGIVFQESAISRMSYVGGDIVFTFSTFERSRGLYAPNAIVQVGNLTYFLSHDGFFATDGNTVQPIGDGKVDETFLGEIAASSLHKITAAKDPVKTLIHFGIQTTGNNPDKIYTYNYSDGRWTRSEQAHQILFSEDNGASPRLLGFSTDNKSGEFDGSALTATIDTQEAILTPGRRSFVSSLRPIVTGSGTITAKLGTRDAPDDSVSYTASVSLNSRTKKAAFRSDAYYHRARVDIAGGFTEAIGVEFDAIPSSAA